MRPFFLFIVTILALVAAPACSKQKPHLQGFNSDLWKKDKKGCEGKRSYLAEILFAHSKTLKGIDDDEVSKLLGNPESSNWEERGKKTYYYYIQSGKQCDSNLALEGSKIAVEFDALGRVKLITEQKY